MKQPTKDALREQLALAADEIIRLKSWQLCAAELIRELRGHRRPWWKRLWDECKAACEVSK